MYVQLIMILLITCYSAYGVKYYCILLVIFQRRLLLNYLHVHTMYKMMEPFPTDDLDLQYVCYKGERVFVSSWHILPIDKGLRMLTGHLLILTHFTLSFPFLTTQELGSSLILDPFYRKQNIPFLVRFCAENTLKKISALVLLKLPVWC